MPACRRVLITCTRQTAPCGGKDKRCSRGAIGKGLDGPEQPPESGNAQIPADASDQTENAPHARSGLFDDIVPPADAPAFDMPASDGGQVAANAAGGAIAGGNKAEDTAIDQAIKLLQQVNKIGVKCTDAARRGRRPL